VQGAPFAVQELVPLAVKPTVPVGSVGDWAEVVTVILQDVLLSEWVSIDVGEQDIEVVVVKIEH
jgi:hypothetical protein